MAKFVKSVVFLVLMGILTACGGGNNTLIPISLNSRFNDEEPALSGNGRFLAFVSSRHGSSEVNVYDLEEKRFIKLQGVNQPDAISSHPSLSRTGRYLVYITSRTGTPAIALYDRITQRNEILTQGYRYWVRNPNISPNGRYITFETARRGQWDIEVLDRGPNIELDVDNGATVVN
jgi:Tol biopolymer transport system component